MSDPNVIDLHARRPPPDDTALGRRFRDGDRAAFDLLARPHLDVLFTVCLRVTGNRAEAEDAAQDALAKAWKARRAFQPERAFRPWLLTVAVNTCRDRLRSRWWRSRVPLPRFLVGGVPEADRACEAAERDAQVREALAELPPLYREALALFHLEDMSYAEMSEITGAAVPALKQRVRRGSAMLREVVRRRYPELDGDRSKGGKQDGAHEQARPPEVSS